MRTARSPSVASHQMSALVGEGDPEVNKFNVDEVKAVIFPSPEKLLHFNNTDISSRSWVTLLIYKISCHFVKWRRLN